jgi:hypothetical protein
LNEERAIVVPAEGGVGGVAEVYDSKEFTRKLK